MLQFIFSFAFLSLLGAQALASCACSGTSLWVSSSRVSSSPLLSPSSHKNFPPSPSPGLSSSVSHSQKTLSSLWTFSSRVSSVPLLNPSFHKNFPPPPSPGLSSSASHSQKTLSSQVLQNLAKEFYAHTAKPAPHPDPCPCQFQLLDCCKEDTDTPCIDCQLFA